MNWANAFQCGLAIRQLDWLFIQVCKLVVDVVLWLFYV